MILSFNFNLFFYLEKTPAIAANYSRGSPEIPAITEMILDAVSSSKFVLRSLI